MSEGQVYCTICLIDAIRVLYSSYNDFSKEKKKLVKEKKPFFFLFPTTNKGLARNTQSLPKDSKEKTKA